MISALEVVAKTIQTNASDQIVELDVSTLVSGIYTLKVVTGDKVMHQQFVKL
ncbi:T9SS type A sorting domain-containing protein [Segetibacter koreensis]|uniref:T9SS type A sorting domain-containing protein n=1 Tax=Segetibacter koreensis TaxID=398037 RepID=UPI000378FBF9|nr:T9SS type A sorting domain-containing protein [Segetibacter koreensis]